MKILFLIYHGFSEYSGISKKIHYQINALKSLGHQLFVCTYDVLDNGRKVRIINNNVIDDYGRGNLASIKSFCSYESIIKYSTDNNIDFVYARSFHNANPFTIHLFHQFKAHGINSVIEIPTYPYDKEYIGFSKLTRFKLKIDQLFRKRLAKETNAIVTFSNNKKIFGQKTICISNGVDFDSIPLHTNINHDINTINFIGVAEVHYWHGFDRLINGIGKYYNNGGTKELFFHIVGGVGNTEMHDSIHAPGFYELAKKYGIEHRIIYNGQLFGKELDDVFDKCDFAIGSLGRHRSGITNIKTIKNREYAARGIPFIYSETDDDFDNMPYVIKAPADESPINIKAIIDFLLEFNLSSNEIRASISHLSWKEQMKKVIQGVENINNNNNFV